MIPNKIDSKNYILVSSYTDPDILAHLPLGINGKKKNSISLVSINKEGIFKIQQEYDFKNTNNTAFFKTVSNHSHKYIYSCNERIDHNGTVSLFTWNPQNLSLQLESQTDALGSSSCYLNCFGNWLYCVNYWTSNLVKIPLIENKLGKAITMGKAITIDKAYSACYVKKYKPTREEHWKFRQLWAHYHCFVIEPYFSKYGFLIDLGSDSILIFKIQEDSNIKRVSKFKLPFHSGPRHIIFHPKLKIAYLVNELLSQVVVIQIDINNNHCMLKIIRTMSTLPKEYNNSLINRYGVWKANSHAAEIKLSPNNQFLIISNRGHDSLTVFKVNNKNGYLLFIDSFGSLGKCPRHFNFSIDGDIVIVANQNSNNLVSFSFSDDGNLCLLDKIMISSPNYISDYLN